MEYLGRIQENKDITNKEWIEDNIIEGHSIENPSGVAVAHRESLRFTDATPQDNNGQTQVAITRLMTKAAMNVLSTADKYGFIETIDEEDEYISNGHTIINSSGASMKDQPNLKFDGMNVTNNDQNEMTIVHSPIKVCATEEEWNQKSQAEKDDPNIVWLLPWK